MTSSSKPKIIKLRDSSSKAIPNSQNSKTPNSNNSISINQTLKTTNFLIFHKFKKEQLKK